MVAEKRKRQFNSCTPALETVKDEDLSGKTYVITGTTSGIGIQTARVLSLRGAHVVMLNRNVVQSEEIKNKILVEKPDAQIDIIKCDLNSLYSVKAAAEEYVNRNWPIHGLILNAGIMLPSNKTTSDGFDSQFGVNHLAHFLLVRELLPVLRASAPSRIVVVSSLSNGHTRLNKKMGVNEKLEKLCPPDQNEFSYTLYAYSKMCNVLMAFKLHREEFDKNNISVYAVHPGVIKTDLLRDLGILGSIWSTLSQPFIKNVHQGAATQVYCAANPEVSRVSGKFWDSCWDDEKVLDKNIARDSELQDELWRKSGELIDEFFSVQKL